MKRSEATRLLVTSCFLIVLAALIASGMAPGNPVVEQPETADAGRFVAPDADRYVPDVQFLQYLEYRARLENSSNCR